MTATPNNEAAGVATLQEWYAREIESAENHWIDTLEKRFDDGDDVPGKAHFVALWLAERTPVTVREQPEAFQRVRAAIQRDIDDHGKAEIRQAELEALTPAPSARGADGVNWCDAGYGAIEDSAGREIGLTPGWSVEDRQRMLDAVNATPPASVPVAELVALAEKWRGPYGREKAALMGSFAIPQLLNELTALAQKGDARGQG